jgi:hypothetical protein
VLAHLAFGDEVPLQSFAEFLLEWRCQSAPPAPFQLANDMVFIAPDSAAKWSYELSHFAHVVRAAHQ